MKEKFVVQFYDMDRQFSWLSVTVKHV